ncbi:MAG: hypothetical protein RR341_06225 [Bacteroidales bacterium]
MELNKKEIAILRKYGSKNENIEFINNQSRNEGWQSDILSHYLNYVVSRCGIMNDQIEEWANNIANDLNEISE